MEIRIFWFQATSRCSSQTACRNDKLGFLSPSTDDGECIWIFQIRRSPLRWSAVYPALLQSQRLLPMASRLNPFSADLLAITWVAYWQIDLYAASTYSSNQRWIRFHQRSERARSLTCAFSLFLHFVRLICFCLFNIILHFRCFSNLEWAAGGRRAECRGIPLCKLCSAESTKERRWARTRQSLIRN